MPTDKSATTQLTTAAPVRPLFRGLPSSKDRPAQAPPPPPSPRSSTSNDKQQQKQEDSSSSAVTIKETEDTGCKNESNGHQTQLQPALPPPAPVSSSNTEKTQKDDEPESESAGPQKRRSGRKRKLVGSGFMVSTTAPTGPFRRSRKSKSDTKNLDVEAEYEMAWICSECKEAECMMKADAEQLLICEGPCGRVFHYPCAGLAELPAADEPYICKDCLDQTHACAICHCYGVDNEDVFACSYTFKKCGLFFHESCLSMKNVEVKIVPQQPPAPVLQQVESGNGNERNCESSPSQPQQQTAKRVFVCPAHACWTCNQLDLGKQESDAVADAEEAAGKGKKTLKSSKRKKKKTISRSFASKNDYKVMRCIECPIAYHFSCIPPMSRFHELAILCHEHAASCKLPDLDLEASLQGKIERKVDKISAELFTVRERKRIKGENAFFPGIPGSKLAAKETDLVEKLPPGLPFQFCIPCDIRDEVHAKPPTYRHVHSLQYSSKKPPKLPLSGDRCQCVGECDEACINRMLYIECFGDGSKKNSSTNCNVGPLCGNRQITQRNFIKCKPRREKGKGWGLVTLEKVHKGRCVLEYVGEVINEATKEERLKQWAQDHPNDPNFYIMSLSRGWFIDAREVANLSRFINHSCDPNCVLTAINVGGYMRNAIVALRDLKPNEFLNYDYHFDTRDGDKFVCRCGAANCRGTMKGGGVLSSGSGAAAGAKSALQIWEEAKAGLERDKKFLSEVFEDEEKRRLQVGEFVPGSDNVDELVANGPQPRNRITAIHNRVFLWRNAVQGADFAARSARLGKRNKATLPFNAPTNGKL